MEAFARAGASAGVPEELNLGDIASAMGVVLQQPRGERAGSKESDGSTAWSREDFRTLAEDANGFTRTVLDLCARAPGQWVTRRQAAEAAGVGGASANAQLGGLTKLMKGMFEPDNEHEWPFESEWLEEEEQLRFRLNEEVAHLWLEVSSP
jgi:hypothetical protein